MVRVGGTVEIAALDPAPLLAAVPVLLARWRALNFVGAGVRHPVTGQAHEGLRVINGVHPFPGAVYRLLLRYEAPSEPTAEEWAVARRLADTEPLALDDWERGRVAAARLTGQVDVSWEEFTIRMIADEAAGTSVAVEHADWSARFEVPPAGPVQATVELNWGDAGWLLRGRLEASLRVDPATLPPYEKGKPQLTATVTHPRCLTSAEVVVAAAGSGRWSVTTRVDLRGRRWLRPIVPLLRRRAQRALDRLLARLPERADRLSRLTLPDQVLADLIDAVPVKVADDRLDVALDPQRASSRGSGPGE